METMESCVPPGFRFHPTDEELVGYYLRKKVASQKIDLDVIRDIDLYRIEPWDLQERCRIGYEEQNEWYFFSHKDKKYPTGTRTNRATIAGFWKATGRDKAVYDKAKLIGMRKTLVFYRGRAPNGQKSDWIMHEYRLESDENGPPQEEGWVVCRAFKKRTTGLTKSTLEGWDTSYFYDEQSGTSSVIDPAECISRPVLGYMPNSSFVCKKEIEVAENLKLFNPDDSYFLQLPQLESPSLPLTKRPMSSVSLVSEINNNNHNSNNNEHLEEHNDDDSNKRVTDWRALDKFVASQLSQEERYEGDGITASFDQHDSSDMALMLLENARECEATKLSSFLTSGAGCDAGGICLFEKL
ncbi:NAC domain-containing protein 37 isoform X2 [Eucalyptus grandis]|uniref:NAC domain-containing protein n=3 Tax=Eucalyptus grandis TaxID=71139 RepID=A0A059ASB6_EUCGR|nr:NAC domain-containing protein 37 isoform X2 [Eucalyptus grandis]XP_010029707.1 NAC domain-containing protein 37 isoform X2 [Eucalyptus grandis]KAK3413833.1 hypothetical protein EUGRSUZ_I02366 [Eucalyptus grandis]KAK3413834.1 hypothetical protein EUGRSUZ_I02366 [Eucalyptus grandis]